MHSMLPSDIGRDHPSYEWTGHSSPCDYYCHKAPRAKWRDLQWSLGAEPLWASRERPIVSKRIFGVDCRAVEIYLKRGRTMELKGKVSMGM